MWKKTNVKEILEILSIRNGKSVYGSDATAVGVLGAGCKFYAGYPITPASGIYHKVAEDIPKLKGMCEQPEDEIASIGQVIAAWECGAKSCTATSGPGFSLMQEELGRAIINELGIVVIDAMRIGPSTGQPTKPGAVDLHCVIGGRHGDAGNCVIVLSPSSPQECFELSAAAFNLGEKFRIPVIVAIEGDITALREKVLFPNEIWTFDRDSVSEKRGHHPFGIDGEIAGFIPLGSGKGIHYGGVVHDNWGSRSSYDPKMCRQLIGHLLAKQKRIIPEIRQEQDKYPLFWQELFTEDCELLIVAYGLTARAAKEAVYRLRQEGKKAGLLVLKMIWPLDKILFEKFQNVKKVLVPEANTGQFIEYLYKYFDSDKLIPFNKFWGEAINAGELTEVCRLILRNETNPDSLYWWGEHPNLVLVGEKKDSGIVWDELKENNKESSQKIADEDRTIKFRKEYPFCPGCGYPAFTNIFLEELKEAGLNIDNTILVAGIGCSSIVAPTLNADCDKTSHGRTLNDARVISLLKPEHTVIVVSGDGDQANIGGNHLIHTAREKDKYPILCIALDNELFGMTGGQVSALTPGGAKTVTPVSQKPFDLKKLLYDGCGIDFFARTSVLDKDHLRQTIRRGLKFVKDKKSFIFVQVLAPCPTHFLKRNPDYLNSEKREEIKKSLGIWERE